MYRLYRGGYDARVSRGRTIRIVLIGVSHWHTPFYLEPSVEMKDVQLVGVSDPIPIRAATSLTQGGYHRLERFRISLTRPPASLRSLV